MLATVEQVEAIVGRPLDTGRVDFLLELASGLVSDEMGYTEDPDPIPTDVSLVTAGAVARAMENPAGALFSQTGPWSVRYADDAEPGLYLTAAERARLARVRAGTPAVRGLWTLRTTRGEEFASDLVEEYDPFDESWPA